MSTSLTAAIHANRNADESMTACQHSLKTGNETMTEVSARLADEIDNPVVAPVTPNPADDEPDGIDVKTVVDVTWTRDELENYAFEQGIDIDGLTNKTQIIAAING